MKIVNLFINLRHSHEVFIKQDISWIWKSFERNNFLSFFSIQVSLYTFIEAKLLERQLNSFIIPSGMHKEPILEGGSLYRHFRATRSSFGIEALITFLMEIVHYDKMHAFVSYLKHIKSQLPMFGLQSATRAELVSPHKHFAVSCILADQICYES